MSKGRETFAEMLDKLGIGNKPVEKEQIKGTIPGVFFIEATKPIQVITEVDGNIIQENHLEKGESLEYRVPDNIKHMTIAFDMEEEETGVVYV